MRPALPGRGTVCPVYAGMKGCNGSGREVWAVLAMRQHRETECKGTRDCLDPELGAVPSDITPDFPDETHGPMRRRNGSNGPFLGCRKYPACHETMEIAEATTGEEAD